MAPAAEIGPVVRFQRPSFPSFDRIEQYFQRSRESSWYSNEGACFEEFSRYLEKRVGTPGVPLVNGTLALILAVAALARKELGDRVLIPSFTFPAVIEAVLWNGLQPLFVDISPSHLHIDPTSLMNALSDVPGVSLVIAGSSFGTPPPPRVREQWQSACDEANVPLLVDSAAGFPARSSDGVAIGSQGDAEVVSFHITKPFGIGEGGAVFSAHPQVIEAVRRFANFGFTSERSIEETSGINAKLDELHAATGLAVSEDIDARLSKRRMIAGRILKRIEGAAKEVTPQEGHEYGTYPFLSLLTPSQAIRDRILTDSENAVQLRTYYEPLHRIKAFKDCSAAGSLAVTEDVADRIVSAPVLEDMTEREVGRVADTLTGF